MAASYNFNALFGGIRCGLKVRFNSKSGSGARWDGDSGLGLVVWERNVQYP